MLSFKDWFVKEAMTNTADIAGFSRIAIPMVSRKWMPNVVFDMNPTQNEPDKKKKGCEQLNRNLGKSMETCR